MLTALEQHFLVHHVYVPSAAHFLNGDHDNMQGGAGPGRAYWMTSSKGVDYTMPGEERPEAVYNAKGFIKGHRSEAHRLTWAAIRDHMAHQPASLQQELDDALAASQAEWQRHWDDSHSISPNGYWRANPETLEALRAEDDRHYAAERPIRDRIRAVVLALLPLHEQADSDEPAGLIEWAERLDMSAIDRGWPDAGDGTCCYGSAILGPGHCTCWEPVYNLNQAEPDTTLTPGVMPRRCPDCAFLRNSPERADEYASEQLDRLVADGERFWCHDGMRRPKYWRHPSGATVEGDPADYQPPIIDGVPYRANGRPGDLCAGWTARRLQAAWRAKL